MPSKMTMFVGLVLIAAVGVIGGQMFSSKGTTNSVSGNLLEPNMTPDLNLGKMHFDAKCAACHGQTAAGTDKGPTFVHKVYHPGHHGDQSFMVAPVQGVKAHHWPFGDMPPVQGVSEKQRKLILSYVRAVQQANGLF